MLLGHLCGQCHNGKGVSALLNKCVSCGNASVLLIIALGMQSDSTYIHTYIYTYIDTYVHSLYVCVILFIIFSHSWHHSDHCYSIIFTVTKAMVVSIPLLLTGNYVCTPISLCLQLHRTKLIYVAMYIYVLLFMQFLCQYIILCVFILCSSVVMHYVCVCRLHHILLSTFQQLFLLFNNM